MEIIYGPVSSWRLGKSLGIDLICSNKKTCSFDCIYCQLGKESNKTLSRKDFISMDKLNTELTNKLQLVSPDFITFSGLGEPTLAKNLDEAIILTNKITKVPCAILTNSTLLHDINVIKSLSLLDVVIAKLDAPNEKLFQEINQPFDGIYLNDVIKDLKNFKNRYLGKFCIQTMFMKNNFNYFKDIGEILFEINPDEVQVNTPLRPCGIKPLNKQQIAKIDTFFKDGGLNTISVYSSDKPMTSPLDKIEMLRRRKSEQ